MKFSRMLVQGLVAIAVTISFILSFLIFTNNSNYQIQNKNSVTDATASNQTTIKKSDLYSPSQILWNNKNDLRLVYNNKHNVVNAVQNDMIGWKFGKVKIISKKNTSNYKNILNAKDTIQLVYPLQMSVNFYGDMLGQKNLKINKKYLFNRVIISFDKRDNFIYLGNDKSKTIYSVSVTSGSSKNIIKLLKKTDISLPVNLKIHDERIFMEYTAPVKLNTYSYLINRQDDNSFMSNLLGTNGITTRQSGDITTYSASAYQRLVSDHDKNELAFYDYSKINPVKTKTDILNTSYQLVNQLNIPLSNPKLSYIDWKNKELVFREYVEGFPTFKKSDFGAIKISFSDAGQVVRFSNKSVQVPVPSDQKPVTLKTTAEVLEDLKQVGISDKDISNIEIGYEWEEDSGNSKIVDMIPTYFVKIDNKWYSLSELLGTNDYDGGIQ